MKIKEIRYSAVDPLAPYGVNDRYEMMAEAEEGEDQKIARKALVKEVREWLKESTQRTPPAAPLSQAPLVEINRNDEKIEIAIDNAQTIEELNALSKNLPVHLMTAFVNKLTELKKQ